MKSGPAGGTDVLGEGDGGTLALRAAAPARRGFARHWHGLARLEEAGVAAKALADRDIAASVAAHKVAFFREKAASENWVDYSVAVAGGLRLVPDGEARLALADDYARMVQSGWLLDDAEPFDVLMDVCQATEDRANSPD